MPRRRFRTLWFAVLLAGLAAFAALTVEEAPWGIVSLEQARSKEQARTVLEAWAGAKVTDVAVTAVFWDFLLILVYGITYAAGAILTCSAYPERGRRRLLAVALGAVVVAMLLDGFEDVGLLKMLGAVPDGRLACLPLLPFLCASGNFGLLAVVGLFVFTGATGALWSRLRPPRRGGRRTRNPVGSSITRWTRWRYGAAGTLEAERRRALEKGDRRVPRPGARRAPLQPLPPAAALKPIASFDDLRSPRHPDLPAELRAVYGRDESGRDNVESLDLMVGMFAEVPPQGFGFSDTAFPVCILMASRRPRSDRFVAQDFTPEVYIPAGHAWVGDNTMVSVLLRHYPELRPVLRGVSNAYEPWRCPWRRDEAGGSPHAIE